ncbi:MAG TPA: HlyD family secretion protein [Kofleriaceae bacterium]|jgi:membrane fusion protein (multidrug efflux system)|nr:HlyD family secretion protein [Kofleriaceae bacterium]
MAAKARRAYTILALVAVVVAGAWGLHRWWSAGKEKTDDAQVDADVVPISARVGGVIKVAHITDHSQVKAGDVLFELDTSDLDVELARTEAELEAAKAQQSAADAQVSITQSSSKGGLSTANAQLTGAAASVRSADDMARAAEASVARARADLAQADAELARTQQLLEREAVTKRELEHAQQARAVAKAGLDAAMAQLDSARESKRQATSRVAEAQGRVTQSSPVDAQVAASEASQKLAAARVKSAEVALQKAKLQRSYATITAPQDGTVSKLGAHVGQTIAPGQALLMIVPADTYVTANFKESQVGKMKPGNPVDIEIDAFPDDEFKGVVETISPATGARFSLIPPDNATGNFVKVVQRVPVKIRWRKAPPANVRAGLSAEVVVHVDDVDLTQLDKAPSSAPKQASTAPAAP